MKKVLFYLLIAATIACRAQNVSLDSLLTRLAQTKKDTTRVLTLTALSEYFESENPDTAIIVNYPLIADPEFKVANMYNMVHPMVADIFTVAVGFYYRSRQENQVDHNLPRINRT